MSKRSKRGRRREDLHEKSPGVWVARWRIAGRVGRRYQKTFEADDEKQARETLKILKGESVKRRRSGEGDPERITFGALAALYFDSRQRHMTPDGIERTRGIIENHLVPAFGARRVAALTASDVENYLAARVDAGASPATANREWNTARAILRFGDRKRNIPEHITRKVDSFKLPDGGAKKVFFSPDEWDRFMRAFENESAWHSWIAKSRKLGPVMGGEGIGKPRRFGGGRKAWSADARKRFERFREMQPVFELLLGTGARIGEVVAQEHCAGKWTGLLWRDIDVRSGLLTIRQSKTGKTVTLPLTDSLRLALRRFPQRIGDTPVCCDSSGRPFYIVEVWRAFVQAREIADINSALTPHALRHTLGSWLASAGESLRVIQELLGHSSPVVTAKHYGHLLPADAGKVRALSRIEEIASKARQSGAQVDASVDGASKTANARAD